MKMAKITILGILILLLMSGCVRRVRHIPIEPEPIETVENNKTATRPVGRLYNTTRTESKYNLKPEPYSVGSNQKDPELLGPQRTIDVAKPTVAVATADTIEKPKSVTETTTTSSKLSMSRDECISMIGQAKFDRYSKRFGGEAGAIKRCLILKKLQRG